MNFIERVIETMKTKNISAYKLCKETGISQQTFSNWKAGKQPPIDKAAIIISYLGVSAEYLIGITDEENKHLSLNEQELLNFYRQLPEQEQLRELGRMEAKAEQFRENSSSSRTG